VPAKLFEKSSGELDLEWELAQIRIAQHEAFRR
jgi:hypothetical protein